MAQLIRKKEKVNFNINDRVEFFVIDIPDNYSPSYKTMYGFVSKINKVTMVIMGVNGLTYKEDIDKVKHYIDPFMNTL